MGAFSLAKGPQTPKMRLQQGLRARAGGSALEKGRRFDRSAGLFLTRHL